MIMLRIRPLVTALVLTAFVLGALGTGIASAKTYDRQSSGGSSAPGVPRPGMGPLSGEPDATGNTAPAPTVKDAVAHSGLGQVLPGTAQWWANWMVRVWLGQHSRKN